MNKLLKTYSIKRRYMPREFGVERLNIPYILQAIKNVNEDWLREWHYRKLETYIEVCNKLS